MAMPLQAAPQTQGFLGTLGLPCGRNFVAPPMCPGSDDGMKVTGDESRHLTEMADGVFEGILRWVAMAA